MKKVAFLVAIMAGVYFGLVQIKVESPMFQEYVDNITDQLNWNRFETPYNALKANIPAKESLTYQNVGPASMIVLFAASVLWLKRGGRTTRQAITTAAFPVSAISPLPDPESPALVRARNKTLRMQLLADEISLNNRLKKYPEAIVKAEKDVSYTESAQKTAKEQYDKARRFHDEATASLTNLRDQEKAETEELVEIRKELARLET